MRVVVQLKQILDPRGIAVNRRAGRVFVNREEYLANPADLNALEAALQLKDAEPETEVVVMTAGPAHSETVLREALAMGAAGKKKGLLKVNKVMPNLAEVRNVTNGVVADSFTPALVRSVSLPTINMEIVPVP